MNAVNLSELSMLELFRIEVDNQTPALTTALLALENEPTAASQLEACMRASHSLKGAAKIVGLAAAVRVAHVMEDCFVAAQQGRLQLRQSHVDPLLRGIDLLSHLARSSSPADEPRVDAFIDDLQRAMQSRDDTRPREDTPHPVVPHEEPAGPPTGTRLDASERVLRVTADNLNQLLGLAGESVVASRWLRPFATSLLRLKRLQHDIAQKLDALSDVALPSSPEATARDALNEIKRRVREGEQLLAQQLADLETFDQRSFDLSRRLYEEAVACRMRPFADGVRAMPRMLRDLGRTLGKDVRLEIAGETTPVDRDLLERLDAPLGHLLRNALDHGLETPEQRLAAGKAAQGVVKLHAWHSAGALQISVSDDGQGIDLEALRAAVVERRLVPRDAAAVMSEAELLDFLFLPGFTLTDRVTDISGRGVGLDVVREMVKQVRGTIRVSTKFGQGTRFQLQLPLTLSIVRALLVDIGGEPYAFPLSRIVRTMKIAPDKVETLEGRPHVAFDGRRIGLVTAHQILQVGAPSAAVGELPVIVLGDHQETYGLVIDRYLGEHELVVQALDPRLGKIKDISAAAVMDDGSPVLIIDVDDLIQSVQKLVSSGQLSQLRTGDVGRVEKRKRILVVDDSLTVRELERKLLAQHGFEVEVAVDGMDGWNAVRTGRFELLVTDIDMPRMDGIELVTLIKKDPHLKTLPVMIVSYKDRAEDRRRGLEAGADHYLAKGSFHDEALLRAAVDLIGEPTA